MSRRKVRKRRVPRQRVPREARPISKDNSIIGVLSFVGAFLFLVLIGIIFTDTGNNRSDDYQEEFAYNDNSNEYDKNKNQRPKNNKKPQKNTTGNTKKDTPKDTQKVANNESNNVDKNENEDENKNNKDNKENNNAEKQMAENNKQDEGIRGLPAQQVNKENPKKDFNLSDDEKYRIRYERARRSGSLQELMTLAKWCQDNEMPGRAEDVYRQVISIEPNNPTARAALGYIRLGATWGTEDNAAQLGYHKYKGNYVSAKSLRDKGLFFYEDEWLTKQQLRRKNLVIHEGNVMTKQELKEFKKRQKEEKRKLQSSREERDEKENKIDYSKQITLSFRQVRILTPPIGNWSLSSSGSRGAQGISRSNNPNINNVPNPNSGALRDTLTDSDSGIVLKIQGYSPELLYTFADGSAAQGSEITNLLKAYRGESLNLYQNLRFDRVRRARYGSETMTQQFGIGSSNGKKYAVVLTFFRYGTLTYAIRITYPVPDNKKDNKLVQQKINYLFTYMQKTRNDY
ncbi:tetratricopeptide repeat protein [Candidatus Uabimicrobium amorphum]|uniref:Uncharacterized protein n=1 Tax=Uabimicrobium amorphum TaxID=2596890 RepID=A0A5S9IU48_UABAM|nr:hypothetical protein [Candidatus Uabimicrobium amorphum]BBM88188.1 hypothetical protein UABAM_06605 [Candidatus Uabimicrobium amorphum]